MKYNTVIFDFDGVIVDSWLGIAKGFVKALGAYGITETIENVKKMIGPPFAKLIIEKYGFDQEEGKKAIMIHRKYVQEHGCFEATLYDGVYEMLQTLDNMGVQMAIASNKPIENVKLQIKYFEIEKFFKEVIAQDTMQTRGEKSDLVKEAMDKLNIKDPKKVLMIGDKPTDIIGGKKNGTDAVMADYGYGSEEEKETCNANYHIKTPLELINIVKGE
ncbi:HAD family hydrolase [Anaerofustis stercorihominis]|uniref:HAD family hydrolase n=1 Tax=Anaerofustis stercorihominis TaxID=214853 RepID=UPI0011060386|nr:HAD-IA family hydrolase [Anaerofustis stercorihominis]